MSDTSVPKKWVASQITSQKGKTVIITGANSGIGYVTALELARHGADVVLACRSADKGLAAVKMIEEELHLSPQAGRVEFRKLDVSSLASVQAFADQYKTTHTSLDLLINNAGIMAVPYAQSVDGYESQFATNHLGHFALTSHLVGLLKKSPSARIVNVSSMAHRQAKVDMKKIQIMKTEATYSKIDVYADSKLYNLLFTFELNRRFKTQGVANVIATSCHPGFTQTNLTGPVLENNWFLRMLSPIVFMLPIVQTSEYGALPTLYAATGPKVNANDYFGPDGFGTLTGYPSKQEPLELAKSEEHAQKLWVESVRLAKLTFNL